MLLTEFSLMCQTLSHAVILHGTGDALLVWMDVKFVKYALSYDAAVIQWITFFHKTGMTTRAITLCRVHVTSLTTSMSAMRFLFEIMLILKAIKFHF